jgi:hypothetical protein
LIGGDVDRSGISAVLLFGSRARGDSSRGSDTDLLLVSAGGMPRHRSSGHLSMFFYPWPKLVEDARAGDLFVCHLTMEAQPVYDPTLRLDELRAEFRLQSSYAREIAAASDVGWFLDQHANELVPAVVTRRMLWCVRTILIAKSAERGEPVFAPIRLASKTSSAAAAELLLDRHQRKPDASMRRRFRSFLTEQAVASSIGESAELGDYERWFERSGNAVGLRTLRSGLTAHEDYT